jgi:hypothetical protein
MSPMSFASKALLILANDRSFPRSMFASQAAWMEKHCALRWSICSDDRAGRGFDRRSDGKRCGFKGLSGMVQTALQIDTVASFNSTKHYYIGLQPLDGIFAHHKDLGTLEKAIVIPLTISNG